MGKGYFFWPFSLASEYDPKIFAIGKSWGNAPLHYGFGSEMLVRERLSSDLPTYEIGSQELKMIIQEKYPFPIQVAMLLQYLVIIFKERICNLVIIIIM